MTGSDEQRVRLELKLPVISYEVWCHCRGLKVVRGG
ncbi:hypothetical protein KLVA5327_20625 [Klebsiella variicola subsp. variicola]|nr:Uncharacterised protein [Klebsiella pneumoniae]SXP64601.1 Uncharacterised protein [Klebsiella pneumoniae]VTN69308.1 Uncharacterised protein [Klebsiella variicola]DAI99158.1 MAG TPA: hypothetical protein [Caudoviricetes sp.]